MRKYKTILAFILCFLLISSGVFTIGVGLIKTSKNIKSYYSKKTKELNPYLKDARSRMLELNTIETVEIAHKKINDKNNKEKDLYIINYTNYNVNGSYFKFMIESKKPITSFEDIKLEDIEKISEIYTSTIEENGKIKEGVYSYLQTKDGKKNKGPFFTEKPLEKIDIRKMHKLTDNYVINGTFDFLYNLAGIDFKKEETEDIITLTGNYLNMNITIKLNKKTMLPIEEIYKSKVLDLKRYYIGYNNELFDNNEFKEKTNEEKLKFITERIKSEKK